MIVNMWMTRDLATIEPKAPITEAAILMAKRHIRQLPVVSPDGSGRQLVGIISATDLFRAFPPDVNPFAVQIPEQRKPKSTVEEVMSRQPHTIGADAPIEEAARLMRDYDVSALPVVRQQALVGLITASDIFRAFVSFFDAAGASIRITYDVAVGEDVFAFLVKAIAKRDAHIVSLITSLQGNHRVCVAQLAGPAVDDVLNEIWKSGHHVLNVIRLP